MQKFYTSFQPTSQVHIKWMSSWCTKLNRWDEHGIHVYMYITHTECKWILGLYKQLVSCALPSPLSMHYLTEMGTYLSQMATLNYTASYFHHIGQTTRTPYSTYHLDYSIRLHFISLGIGRQPNQQKYRRSRVAKNLFHKIQPIARKWKNWHRLNINWGITVSNLIVIKKEPIPS